jgi:hypothetical protein
MRLTFERPNARTIGPAWGAALALLAALDSSSALVLGFDGCPRGGLVLYPLRATPSSPAGAFGASGSGPVLAKATLLRVNCPSDGRMRMNRDLET